jgi:flagellar biosynthesis component FlhA
MMSAQTEAQVRKKPKRIIQNQIVILLLFMLPLPVTFVVVELIFYVEGIFPPFFLSLLVTWAIACAVYVTLWLHVKRQNNRT